MNQITPAFHVGRASDLSGSDRILYRFFEMVPGILTWGTLIGTVFLSYYLPTGAAVFIIAFDVYWLLKTIYLSLHLRQNWLRLKRHLKTDWKGLLTSTSYDHIYHLVILPFYRESKETIERSIEALCRTGYDKKKLIVVIAGEERAGESARVTAQYIEEKYRGKFGHLISTFHPQNLDGEIPGKGSNISFAAEEVRRNIFDVEKIPYGDVMVSAFDIDTVVYPDYFFCITWYFLKSSNPHRVSFQPVPLYNNNIWQAPALSRVVAGSGTFWQMIQQERPEKLVTFSSHALSFKTLYELGYWQKNMVSEDSRIFWNAFFTFDGDYSVVSISYPVSMDANVAPTLWATIRNVYKQQRRWAWGSENIPYILFNMFKNKKISFFRKIRISFVQLEGYWSLATNPLLIFLLGWLPVVIGGKVFNSTLLSYNLPFITRDLMILSMTGLMLSAIISLNLLPEMPAGYTARHRVFMFVQWIFVPVTIIIFGAIPGIDAQTRLMLGNYMGFWVTPKTAEKESV